MAFISENKIKKDRQELRAARQRILDEVSYNLKRRLTN